MADFHLPQLGDSVTEGLITTWLKAVGDKVEKNEPLLEVTTDKVSIEIPSDLDGVVTEILVESGQTVQPETIICRIEPTQK